MFTNDYDKDYRFNFNFEDLLTYTSSLSNIATESILSGCVNYLKDISRNSKSALLDQLCYLFPKTIIDFKHAPKLMKFLYLQYNAEVVNQVITDYVDSLVKEQDAKRNRT